MHKNIYLVCSFYKFIYLKDLENLKKDLLFFFKKKEIKGTILISNEGINGSLSLQNKNLDEVKNYIRKNVASEIFFKIQEHHSHAFLRLKGKIKKEIIKLGQKDINPSSKTGTLVKPENWYEIIDSENFIILDTRNNYESKIGTFKNSHKVNTENFTDFPNWFKENQSILDKKKIAMFCTGGIRCEKASNFLLNTGLKKVYQLEGGIINYLSKTKNQSKKWLGECFVFDERVSLNEKLDKGVSLQCFACRTPITKEDLQSKFYRKGISCPHCFNKTTKNQKKNFKEREKQINLAKIRGVKHLGS